jgi:hypothetical protein
VPLALVGEPQSPDWMGLVWSAWQLLSAAELREVPAGAGVYHIRAGGESLLYVGQSGALASRLRTHARSDGWPGPVSFSTATMPPEYTSAQLLEAENDLIAGYFTHAGHAPVMQFGQDAGAPPD